jgi:hypothetical protein
VPQVSSSDTHLLESVLTPPPSTKTSAYWKRVMAYYPELPFLTKNHLAAMLREAVKP